MPIKKLALEISGCSASSKDILKKILLEKNCFAISCWFLPYIDMHQPDDPSLLILPPISHPIPSLYVVTEHWAEFPVSQRKFLLHKVSVIKMRDIRYLQRAEKDQVLWIFFLFFKLKYSWFTPVYFQHLKIQLYMRQREDLFWILLAQLRQ